MPQALVGLFGAGGAAAGGAAGAGTVLAPAAGALGAAELGLAGTGVLGGAGAGTVLAPAVSPFAAATAAPTAAPSIFSGFGARAAEFGESAKGIAQDRFTSALENPRASAVGSQEASPATALQRQPFQGGDPDAIAALLQTILGGVS